MKSPRSTQPVGSAPAVRAVTASSGNGLLRALLEATIEREAEARFEVDGGSMLPLIRPHDVVHVQGRAASGLRTGDITAARRPGGCGVLVHRVVARKGERLLVQGDNCPRADGLYLAADLIGVVSEVERDGRSVWFGSGRLGWLVAFAVRHGLVWRFNRAYYGLHRRISRRLKFAAADTRLRQRKGCEGNE